MGAWAAYARLHSQTRPAALITIRLWAPVLITFAGLASGPDYNWSGRPLSRLQYTRWRGRCAVYFLRGLRPNSLFGFISHRGFWLSPLPVPPLARGAWMMGCLWEPASAPDYKREGHWVRSIWLAFPSAGGHGALFVVCSIVRNSALVPVAVAPLEEPRVVPVQVGLCGYGRHPQDSLVLEPPG